MFVSENPAINYPMACEKTDNFASIEEKLYYEFPDLKFKRINFISNGNILNMFYTLEQNKIKNGDTILIKEN